jgi:hypothetical protein
LALPEGIGVFGFDPPAGGPLDERVHIRSRYNGLNGGGNWTLCCRILQSFRNMTVPACHFVHSKQRASAAIIRI